MEIYTKKEENQKKKKKIRRKEAKITFLLVLKRYIYTYIYILPTI